MLPSPEFTKAMLIDQERRVRQLRHVTEARRMKRIRRSAKPQRRWWSFRLRDPLRV